MVEILTMQQQQYRRRSSARSTRPTVSVEMCVTLISSSKQGGCRKLNCGSVERPNHSRQEKIRIGTLKVEIFAQKVFKNMKLAQLGKLARAVKDKQTTFFLRLICWQGMPWPAEVPTFAPPPHS